MLSRRSFLTRVSAAVLGVVAGVYAPARMWKSDIWPFPEVLAVGVHHGFYRGREISISIPDPHAPIWFMSRVSDPYDW